MSGGWLKDGWNGCHMSCGVLEDGLYGYNMAYWLVESTCRKNGCQVICDG